MDFKERLIDLLSHPNIYDENIISYIDLNGKQHSVYSFGDIFDGKDKTIKIEAMEKVFKDVYKKTLDIKAMSGHVGVTNAHLFWATKNAPSFDLHTDPYDVYIKCMWGTKTMLIDGQIVEINIDDPALCIPNGVLHKALNYEESIMISYGNETFLEERWLV